MRLHCSRYIWGALTLGAVFAGLANARNDSSDVTPPESARPDRYISLHVVQSPPPENLHLRQRRPNRIAVSAERPFRLKGDTLERDFRLGDSWRSYRRLERVEPLATVESKP